MGGEDGIYLEYKHLGRSEGFGSYHFSRETLDLMDVLLARSQEGRRVNSIFGEGVSPKLRKIRSALDYAGLPADLLLQHGSVREVFAVPLAKNFRDVLIGLSRRPIPILPHSDETASKVADYWRQRWLAKRLARPGILEEVAKHTLALPVSHGARVVMSPRSDTPRTSIRPELLPAISPES
jgi:hypothetical protein